MIIQIDGVNTQNKGAELMLVAILEEMELRYPKSTIYINPDSKFDISFLAKYNLSIKLRPGLKIGRYVNKALFVLGIKENPFNYFKENYVPKGVDIILDASGFKYSDQWNRSEKWLNAKEIYYKQAKSNGTKIYFLTQALGPFKTKNGMRSMLMLSKYASVIFAREEVSYNFALEAGASVEKMKISSDFTLNVNGIVPKKFEHLKGAIVMIPNKKMITHSSNKSEGYLNLFLEIIRYNQREGNPIFLLNHESQGDYDICEMINSYLDIKLEIVSNLSAKEVKGVIGIGKMVISSRFHGVASALSQGVPCLSTSWNHKYEMLFKNFGQSDCIIDANKNINENMEKIKKVNSNIEDIRYELKDKKKSFLIQIDSMWNIIFEDYESQKIY